jgi:hypothetical protein
MWKVTDPVRVADGLYGITWHRTKREAQRRCEMFRGSVMEFVSEAP